MSVMHAFCNTVLTMNTIEENIDILLKNVENILDRHVEFSKDAETVQDAYAVARACFEVLVENVLEYAEIGKKLISENKKDCKAKLNAVLEANA